MGNHPNRSQVSKVWDNFGMGWIASSPRYGCSPPNPTRDDALEWLLSKGIKPEHIEGTDEHAALLRRRGASSGLTNT